MDSWKTRQGPQIRIIKGLSSPHSPLQVFIDEFGDRPEENYCCRVIKMEQIKEGEIYQEDRPCLQISPASAQTLIDDLWEAGLRPSEGTGSAGSLAATQKHLQDMRTIAFNKLGIKEVLK